MKKIETNESVISDIYRDIFENINEYIYLQDLAKTVRNVLNEAKQKILQ